MMEAGASGQAAGDAVAIVVGIFEPGSVVELYHVESGNVLRAEGGELVGRRVADQNELVGFDGLIEGDHYFATGYSRGRLEERRIVAREVNEAADQQQPAPQPAPVTLGVEQTPVEDVPSAEVATPAEPEVAEGEEPLEVGLPDGVVSPVLSDSLYLRQGEADEAGFELADVQTPAETASDGSPKDSQPLYRHTGGGEVDPAEWQLYEGATEPVPAPDTAPSPSSGEAPAGPAQTTDTPGDAGEESNVTAGGVTVETATTTTATPADPVPADTPSADAPAPDAGAADAPPAEATDAQGQPEQPPAIDQSGAVAPVDAAAGEQAAGNAEAVPTQDAPVGTDAAGSDAPAQEPPAEQPAV